MPPPIAQPFGDNPFVDELWGALAGDSGAMAHATVLGIGDLPSRFRVTDLAVASIGVAALAARELAVVGAEDGASDPTPLTVDRQLAASWFASAVEPIGWELPPAWDSLAGNYRTSTGWIRLHTNAPAHRAGALRVLGLLGADATHDEVERRVARWNAVELETAIVDAGGCAGVLHSAADWSRHPQGRAVAEEPILAWEWRSGSRHSRQTPWLPRSDRPLAGLRVLDLTRVIAGPVATRFLAGLGADVLRIDPPDWHEPALVPNMTLGKRAARLDARDPRGQERLRTLISESDILVHGYRNGALDALVPDRTSSAPDLIEASLDAYGFSGPWAARRGFDSVVQLSTGLADAGGDNPVALPVQALDHSSGYLLAAGVLRALTLRRRDGSTAHVRTSLARVARLLLERGPSDGDAPILSPTAGPQSRLDTPWGPSTLLDPPIALDGIPFRFDRAPRDLGSDRPSWESERMV